MDAKFELPQELTIYNVQEVRGALLEWLKVQQTTGAEPLLLSARRVEVIDGAGLQVLASLDRTHANWKLADASPVFSEACRVMGLQGWLASPYLAPVEGALA